MVATDVASRGIGMIYRCTSFPLPPPFPIYPLIPLLSCVVWFCCSALCYLCALLMPSLVKTHQYAYLDVPAGGPWMPDAVLPATLSTPSYLVPTGYRGGLVFP